jgi:hypothetical protein
MYACITVLHYVLERKREKWLLSSPSSSVSSKVQRNTAIGRVLLHAEREMTSVMHVV